MKGSAMAAMVAESARLLSGVQVAWKEGLPPRRQSVFFANHASHLDFVVLWASLPSEIRAVTRPVAARDYWNAGVRRFFAVDIFNAILVERNVEGADRQLAARSTIDRIAAAMGDEYSLIIFPEGTRGTGEEIAPFKSGLYYLCTQKPNLQLVPAFIKNLNRVLPKGQILPVPLISQITFGAPTQLQASEPKGAFLERMRDALCALRDE